MNRHSTINRRLVWLSVCFGFWCVLCCCAARTVSAQDDSEAEEATASADEKPAGKSSAKAVDKEGDKGTGEDSASPQERSMLSWIAESSGWIGVVILVLSVYFVATVIRMFLELRPEILTPPELVAECEELLQARDVMGIVKRLKASKSFFATVATAGVYELQSGLAEARDAMDRVGEVNTIGLEKKISMLAVLGTLGPMIGLLGTLKGMIASFSVIALSDTQLKASEVAGGISEALLLTFEGVGLSVPAIYFFAIFRNRVSAFSAQALLDADAFIRRINALVRPKPAAQGTARHAAPQGVAAE